MYRIDEGLGLISTEVTDHFDLLLVRENRFDERDDLEWRQGVTD